MINILIFIFIVLLTMPIFVANIYYKKREGEILYINQNKTKDPRYFGKSFSKLIETNISFIENEEINLSRKEKVIYGEDIIFEDKQVEKIVISKNKDFKTNENMIFNKEIYSYGNIFIDKDTELRGLYSKKNIILSDKTKVIRWVDSDGTIAVYDDCDLGVSLSSAKRISIGVNCNFRRIYAPEIYIGQYPDEILDYTKGKNPNIYTMPIQKSKERNIRYISDEMVSEDGIVDYSILSNSNVMITENIIVKGDIRSHKGIRIFDNSVVIGNIFAEKDIIIGKNAAVLGNVFSQGNIILEEGASIGKKGSISSIIARGKITLAQKTFVFGFLSCEKQGSILGNTSQVKKYEYLKEALNIKKLEFSTLEAYEGVYQTGFRFNSDIEEVIVPEGATKVYRSMFFNCSNLKKVILPKTIEVIEDFAFANCENLKHISLTDKTNLMRIGVSAFENCKSIYEIDIPESVKEFGTACFLGCINLRTIKFNENINFKILPDHIFTGCINLEDIDIPKDVIVSEIAFQDCNTELKYSVYNEG